jgi:hypothetical protein
MVRGLHRKWKQPVAYYFIRGSTKANLLVRFLNEVLGACQNAGIHVVATVCDMDANNVKALKLLGAIGRKPFFKFEDRGIVTVYDPPHLLKCTRNLFPKYDVQFESERIHNRHFVTAKWEHILNVYKWEKQKIVRLLYKLNDAHLALVTQEAMKFSLAAQVMSHTVGATLNSFSSASKKHCSAFMVFVMRHKLTFELHLFLSMTVFLSDFTMTIKFTTNDLCTCSAMICGQYRYLRCE